MAEEPPTYVRIEADSVSLKGFSSTSADTDAATKAYVDQVRTDLMGDLPQTTLDTITEIAAYLEGSGVAGGLMEQITGLRDDLTAESATRLANDTTEQTRAEAAEAALETAIEQEVSDRQAAVTAEQTRALAAEAALDVRVDGAIATASTANLAEQTRATSEEAALGTRIDTLTTSASAATALKANILNPELKGSIRLTEVSAGSGFYLYLGPYWRIYTTSDGLQLIFQHGDLVLGKMEWKNAIPFIAPAPST